MNNECVKILQKKRNIELESLGIDPQLYGSVIKLINRTTQITIVKERIIVSSIIEGKTSKVSMGTISKDVSSVYGISERLTQLIINEWLRESVIMVNMSKDIINNWEFISLENNFKEKTDNYNF